MCVAMKWWTLFCSVYGDCRRKVGFEVENRKEGKVVVGKKAGVDIGWVNGSKNLTLMAFLFTCIIIFLIILFLFNSL